VESGLTNWIIAVKSGREWAVNIYTVRC
jgi:hypothetical protein